MEGWKSSLKLQNCHTFITTLKASLYKVKWSACFRTLFCHCHEWVVPLPFFHLAFEIIEGSLLCGAAITPLKLVDLTKWCKKCDLTPIAFRFFECTWSCNSKVHICISHTCNFNCKKEVNLKRVWGFDLHLQFSQVHWFQLFFLKQVMSTSQIWLLQLIKNWLVHSTIANHKGCHVKKKLNIYEVNVHSFIF